MAWRTVGSHRYYQQTYRDVDGKVRTRYVGCGRVAAAVAWLDAHRRERWIEVGMERREVAESARRLVESARRRIIQLGGIVDRAMIAGGFYKHRGTWRRRGVTTMRTIKDYANEISVDMALRRELARRHFEALDGDELAAEIQRFNIEMSTVALNALISRITSDPYEQEACLRRARQSEKKLAGKTADPLVRILARSLVMLRIEKYFADTKFYEFIGDGLGTPLARHVLRWRDFVDRQLNAKVRLLAEVRRLEAWEIERTVERMRLVPIGRESGRLPIEGAGPLALEPPEH